LAEAAAVADEVEQCLKDFRVFIYEKRIVSRAARKLHGSCISRVYAVGGWQKSVNTCRYS
jgi:hypothetical protein